MMKKNNPIFDENDHEYNMQKIDLQAYIDNLNWKYSLQDNKFNYQLKELIEKFILNLDMLKNILEHHILLLKMKTNDFYRDYYKTEAHKVLESKSHNCSNLNNDLQLKEDYNLLSWDCENNPYMILLNAYEHHNKELSKFSRNIKKYNWLIAEQSILISKPLDIDISTFYSLQEWEDSILINQLSYSNIIS